MNTYNWKEITDKLNQYVRLGKTPVAIKWVATEEELMAIPKVRIHKKRFSPCTIVEQAAQFNWTAACRSEIVHANYCRGINGMFDRDEKWFSGEIFNGVWFDNAEAARAHHEALNCIPPKYIAMVASPLASGRIEPDVCVIDAIPAQAFMILAAYMHSSFKQINFSFAGESTCSDTWCKTFTTGEPGMGLPCYADKKFAGMGDNEVRLSFTPDDMVKVVEGLEGLFKNGLRYPIASYSLLTDIMDGLPKSYLEY